MWQRRQIAILRTSENLLTSDRLLNLIHEVFAKRQEYVERMDDSSDRALEKLLDLITTTA